MELSLSSLMKRLRAWCPKVTLGRSRTSASFRRIPSLEMLAGNGWALVIIGSGLAAVLHALAAYQALAGPDDFSYAFLHLLSLFLLVALGFSVRRIGGSPVPTSDLLTRVGLVFWTYAIASLFTSINNLAQVYALITRVPSLTDVRLDLLADSLGLISNTILLVITSRFLRTSKLDPKGVLLAGICLASYALGESLVIAELVKTIVGVPLNLGVASSWVMWLAGLLRNAALLLLSVDILHSRKLRWRSVVLVVLVAGVSYFLASLSGFLSELPYLYEPFYILHWQIFLNEHLSSLILSLLGVVLSFLVVRASFSLINGDSWTGRNSKLAAYALFGYAILELIPTLRGLGRAVYTLLTVPGTDIGNVSEYSIPSFIVSLPYLAALFSLAVLQYREHEKQTNQLLHTGPDGTVEGNLDPTVMTEWS